MVKTKPKTFIIGDQQPRSCIIKKKTKGGDNMDKVQRLSREGVAPNDWVRHSSQYKTF